MTPNWCSEHSNPHPCFKCNILISAAGPAVAAVYGPFGEVVVAPLVDPVFVDRLRRTMMGDLLWLADLIAGLSAEDCVCGGAPCPA